MQIKFFERKLVPREKGPGSLSRKQVALLFFKEIDLGTLQGNVRFLVSYFFLLKILWLSIYFAKSRLQ